MTQAANLDTKSWYDQSYSHQGFGAQRRYPNEELLRFFGRHYFHLAPEKRSNVRILEAGCGSGANLWMIAREGFDAHGVELSPAAVGLCSKMLDHWGTSATVKVGDMTTIPYPAQHFDVVIDVFSSNCLDEAGFFRFLDEVVRLLRAGGRYFSYTPSKRSDAFKDRGPSQLLDSSTLDGIRREGSPFFDNLYPFRFIAAEEYRAALEKRGLTVTYLETVSRTYRTMNEYFEFVVVEGVA